MMKENNLKLTKVDRTILESYRCMLDGLSHYLGTSYELVLHSLEDYNHAAIKVINGFHTGRSEGAPITDLALEMLEKIEEHKEPLQGITYFGKNKKGEPLKSATLVVRGENQRIIGLLCMNCYLNTPTMDFLKSFIPPEKVQEILPSPVASLPAESYSTNTSELVEKMVQQEQQTVMADSAVIFTNKNKEIIRRLYAKGVFNLKDAVLKTSQILNVSKNTVYLHLRNIESGQSEHK